MKPITKIALLRLYCGESGKQGFYNSQEIGLAKAYARKGYDVLIVYPQKKNSQKKIYKVNEKIILMYVPAKTIGVHSYYKLDFLLEYNISLVQIAADNQLYAPAVMRYCQKHHIQFYNYVGTIFSDTDNNIKKWILKIFTKRNIRYFRKTQTYAKTDHVLKQLRENGVKEAKVVSVGLDLEIIPNILESKAEIRKQLALPQEKKILLFVGRLASFKRPLDALELLNKMSEEYYLVMIGNGDLQALVLSRIEEMSLTNRVTYIEAIPNVDIHKYFRCSDCFVNFNEHEIWGMSILEAMYQGCPVVARHAPGPDTIIVNGKNGYLTKSVEEMSEKIIYIDWSMGKNCKNRVEKEFSWDKAVERFLEDKRLKNEK